MTERDLENIITAYDEGSFLKAAEKLYVTQSALSQSIRKLEKQLDGKLFVCKGNRVEPTPLCSEIVSLGRPVYYQWLEFQKKTEDLVSKKQDSVTILSNEAILTSILFPAIGRFKLSHDDIRFQILERRTLEAEQDLTEGRADLGIFPTKLGGSKIVSLPLIPTEYYLAVPNSHPYAKAHPFTCLSEADFADLKDFEDSEFVFPRKANRWHEDQKEIFNEAGISPKAGIETVSVNTLISYVESELYCALINSCYADGYTNIPGISYYRLDLSAAKGYIYACYPASRPLTPVMEELLKEIKA